tara:strand:+ start:418 stop:630 length:213 start_codon:yes stop_codon:yes gene_type:complete
MKHNMQRNPAFLTRLASKCMIQTEHAKPVIILDVWDVGTHPIAATTVFRKFIARPAALETLALFIHTTTI